MHSLSDYVVRNDDTHYCYHCYFHALIIIVLVITIQRFSWRRYKYRDFSNRKTVTVTVTVKTVTGRYFELFESR